MSSFKHLEYVKIEQMNGLKSISNIADAPNLKRTHFSGMNHIPVADYEAFVGHNTLTELTPGYSGKRKLKQIEDMVDLPRVHYERIYDTTEF